MMSDLYMAAILTSLSNKSYLGSFLYVSLMPLEVMLKIHM